MDVRVEVRTSASPAAVARIMFDPTRDPEWIGGARRVDPPEGAMGVGLRIRRHGGFLGRAFSWVTEVTAFEPERRVDMRFVEGPMRGHVSYLVAPAEGGSLVAVHNRGAASFELPGMAWMVRRSVANDLARLVALVERAD